MLQKKSVPGRRLARRVIALSVIAALSAVLELLHQTAGRVAWIVLELGMWFFYLFYEFDSQLLRLKSRPDSEEGVSLAETLQGDFVARLVLVGYVLLLLLIVLHRVVLKEQAVHITPGVLFLSLAPIALFAFWRQYRFEQESRAT